MSVIITIYPYAVVVHTLHALLILRKRSHEEGVEAFDPSWIRTKFQVGMHVFRPKNSRDKVAKSNQSIGGNELVHSRNGHCDCILVSVLKVSVVQKQIEINSRCFGTGFVCCA